MRKKRANHSEGEFIWLVSLSDLMILLFVFFVVLFSFSAGKLSAEDYRQAAATLRGEAPKVNEIRELKDRILKELSEMALEREILVEAKNGELNIDIREKFLFESGKFEVNQDGIRIIGHLSRVLSGIPVPYRVAIQGHTDDAPMQNGIVSDNWELSSKRAHSVLRVLGLPSEVLSRTVIEGFAEMKPVAPNRDDSGHAIPENRAKNRRVTIKVY